jgi:uncharacterized damage-inducible protein DinB
MGAPEVALAARSRRAYAPTRGIAMTWMQFLRDEIEVTYASTEKLLDKVDPNTLDWKPDHGCNWMTLGQLLRHISEACGAGIRAFVYGDWGLPEGVKIGDLTPEEMLPPAKKLPGIENVERARKLLSKDKAVALQTLTEVNEDQLENRRLAAPWAPGIELALGRHLFQMVQHLDRHKAQLFYYLKLQGKPVNTADLWG